MMGYICTEEHGFQAECDVSKAGARICPECGMEVVGITTTQVARWAGIDQSKVEQIDARAYAEAVADGNAEVTYP